MTTTLNVEGMSCSSCAARIHEALRLDGVATVEVAVDRGTVTVVHAPAVKEVALVKALESAGYGARSRKGCCCG
ncbi:MAG: heavy-metal-associated domain-containing protein [Kofleriaceae bacterium]